MILKIVKKVLNLLFLYKKREPRESGNPVLFDYNLNWDKLAYFYDFYSNLKQFKMGQFILQLSLFKNNYNLKWDKNPCFCMGYFVFI